MSIGISTIIPYISDKIASNPRAVTTTLIATSSALRGVGMHDSLGIVIDGVNFAFDAMSETESDFDVYASGLRFGCKSLVTVGAWSLGVFYLPASLLAADLICEPLYYFAKTVDEKRKEAGQQEVGFKGFVSKNIEFSWVSQSLLKGTVSTGIVSTLGSANYLGGGVPSSFFKALLKVEVKKLTDENIVWLINRVPNIQEAGITIVAMALVDTFMKLPADMNPSAKTIVRDLVKVIPVAISFAMGTEVGGTGYSYDTGNLLSAFIKPMCKGLIIAPFYNTNLMEKVALGANYPCEGVSRYFVVVGQKRMDDKETDYDYFKYMYSHSELGWIAESFGSSSIKTFISNYIGGQVKGLGIESKIQGSMDSVGQYIGLTPGLAGKFIVKLSNNAVTTYLLTPPARIIQDGVSKISQILEERIYGPTEHVSHVICEVDSNKGVYKCGTELLESHPAILPSGEVAALPDQEGVVAPAA